MAKTFEEIRDCVREKVREFCFIGTTITDNEIGAKLISELNFTQVPSIPGKAPIDAFANKLRTCTDVDIPDFTGEELQKHLDWTVDKIAESIYGKSLFKNIRDCVRAKVREFCFEGATITDDEIGTKTIHELNLTQGPHMPGVPPIYGLAINLKSCTNVDIPDFTGEELQNHPNWTVDKIAQIIYGQSR